MSKHKLPILLMTAFVVLVACSGGDKEAEPTQTPSSTPTLQPSATPTPTDLPPTAVPPPTDIPAETPQEAAAVNLEAACPDIIQAAYQNAETACAGTGQDQACYGNITVEPEPADLPFKQTGDIVDLASLDGLRLSSMDAANAEWGISLLRVQAAEGEQASVELVLFGNVEVQEIGIGEGGGLTSFVFQSGVDDSPCEAAPDSGIMIQTPQGVGEIAFLVNEVSIELGSTAYLQAQAGEEMLVNVVEGQATTTSQGRTVIVPAGTRSRVPLSDDGLAAGVPSDPEPYEQIQVDVLPVTLLEDEIVIAPALAEEDIPAAIAAGSAAVGEAALESNFDSDIEGWSIFADGTPLEHLTEGNTGFVCSNDLSTGVYWYFLAPSQWSGDWSPYYDGALTFAIRQNAVDSQNDQPDVIIETGQGELTFDTLGNPGLDFTRYLVPLNAEAGWVLGGNPVSEEDMRAALSVVSAFRIRGEFRTGADSACLDYASVLLPGDSESGTSSTTQRGGSSNAEGSLGVWQSDFGDITFGPTSSTYTSDSGRMFYEINGNVLSGYWIENSSAQGCSSEMDGSVYWGRIEFTFNDEFTEFTGLWSYCDEEPTAAWNGRYIP